MDFKVLPGAEEAGKKKAYIGVLTLTEILKKDSVARLIATSRCQSEDRGSLISAGRGMFRWGGGEGQMHLAKKTLVQSAEIARERKRPKQSPDHQCLFSQEIASLRSQFPTLDGQDQSN